MSARPRREARITKRPGRWPERAPARSPYQFGRGYTSGSGHGALGHAEQRAALRAPQHRTPPPQRDLDHRARLMHTGHPVGAERAIVEDLPLHRLLTLRVTVGPWLSVTDIVDLHRRPPFAVPGVPHTRNTLELPDSLRRAALP